MKPRELFQLGEEYDSIYMSQVSGGSCSFPVERDYFSKVK